MVPINFVLIYKTCCMNAIDTYKRSICNVQSRRVATSYNAQKNMHWNKVNDKGVPSPRANLKEFLQK